MKRNDFDMLEPIFFSCDSETLNIPINEGNMVMFFLPPEPFYMYPIGYPFQISNHPFFASREYRQLIGGWLLGSFLASVISFMAPIFAMFALIGILYTFARLTLRIIPAKIEVWDCARALATYPLNNKKIF